MDINSRLKHMPFWKWLLLFIFCIPSFVILKCLTDLSWILVPQDSISFLVVRAILIGLSIFIIYRLYYLIVKLLEHRKVSELMLNAQAIKQIFVGFGLGACFITVCTLTLVMMGCYKVDQYQFSHYGLVNLLIMNLIIAVNEEILFSGIFFRYIDARFGYIPALIISAIMFGIVHFWNDNATIWTSVALGFEAGLLYTSTFKYYGSLWIPIGIHWAWNLFEESVYGFAVSGVYDTEVFRFIIPKLKGPDILTGGSFGLEGSIVTVFLGLFASIWYISKYFNENKCKKTAPQQA
ncbi:MAG: CPBP family intramembrane metalloprotease [Salinivirgaceae bacterium]|nr:CPBP family intramembrane metalloprotease [Salinivirgaceae bacterium]